MTARLFRAKYFPPVVAAGDRYGHRTSAWFVGLRDEPISVV